MPQSHLISIDAVSGDLAPGIGVGLIASTPGKPDELRQFVLESDSRRAGLLLGVVQGISRVADRLEPGDQVTFLTEVDKDHLLARGKSGEPLMRLLNSAKESLIYMKRGEITVSFLQADGEEMPSLARAMDLATMALLHSNQN